MVSKKTDVSKKQTNKPFWHFLIKVKFSKNVLYNTFYGNK